MIRSAITCSLVEEARGGPFVYHDGLEDAFERAGKLGFDAIEIFAPGPDAVDPDAVHALVKKTGLAVAAVGTGAGMVKHGLNLCDPDSGKRTEAKEFIASMIQFGGQFEAPAIIGSMQGRWGGDISRDQALGMLGEALDELAPLAAQHSVPLFYEPLNRYETNLLTTIAEGTDYVGTLKNDNVKLLADLFHMNIEEADVADAIRAGKGAIGHVHFVDSNRRATGLGHTDFVPIAAAIKDIGYDGYLCAEAFPIPDADVCAQNTIDTFRQYFSR